jgi:crossover junction endodeoxyribonuclease RuvC
MAAKLIGIDPGLAATGIGVVTGSSRTMVQSYAYGVVNTDPADSTAGRLEEIYSRLHQLFLG